MLLRVTHSSDIQMTREKLGHSFKTTLVQCLLSYCVTFCSFS